MLDIHYMVPVLPKTNQFASLVASQNITWNRFKSSVTANALQYCPCPREAHASFNRRSTVFTRKTIKQGECRRELLICEFEGENTTNALKALNSKIVWSQAGARRSRDTVGILMFVFFYTSFGSIHTSRNKHVYNYSLAGSCFLVSLTSEEIKKIQSFSHRSCWFFCTVASIRCPTNVQQAARRVRGQSQFIKSSSGLVWHNSPLFSSLYTL